MYILVFIPFFFTSLSLSRVRARVRVSHRQNVTLRMAQDKFPQENM